MKRFQFMPMLLGATILLSAFSASAETAVPDAAWAQAWIDQAYVSRHQALTQASDTLASGTAAFCQAPDAKKLASLKQQWLGASLAWRSMDGAPAGPMVLERLGRKIDFRPTRPDDIEAAVTSASAGENNIATRGLGAIEYLLWGNAEPQLGALQNARRCAYLSQLASDVATRTHALDAPWQLYRQELGAENPFFRQNLFSETVNLMLASLTGLGKRIPTAEEINPEQLVEWRSASSKAQIMAQIGGLNTALLAVGQRLRDDDAADLAQALHADLGALQKTCQALPDDVAKAPAKARLACNKAMSKVKARLQNDVAEKLDLTLGFSESDGD